MDNIPVVSVQDLYKTFKRSGGEDLHVLRDINLEVWQGEFIGILGYSGCGKTTLLRIICGFEKAERGAVLIDGLKQERANRKALMLFQDYNQLFPWKTVLGNVMHPLITTGLMKDKQDAKNRAKKRIADVDLSDFENSYPHQLSGGMKQRTAVARALALQPRVLLMDEPFAALDNITRGSLQVLTRRVCDKYGITVVFVTHSIEEAAVMADKIVVMNRSGSIERIFENEARTSPANEDRFALIEDIKDLMDRLKASANA